MNVDQVHKLNKQKENQVCEESRCNDDHRCKNKKIDVTHVKGKQQLKMTLLEAKIS